MSIKLIVDGSVLGNREGKVQTEVDGDTIGECLNCFVQQQPYLKKIILDEKGNVCQGNLISLNGTFIDHDNLTKTARDGDEIWIIKSTGF